MEPQIVTPIQEQMMGTFGLDKQPEGMLIYLSIHFLAEDEPVINISLADLAHRAPAKYNVHRLAPQDVTREVVASETPEFELVETNVTTVELIGAFLLVTDTAYDGELWVHMPYLAYCWLHGLVESPIPPPASRQPIVIADELDLSEDCDPDEHRFACDAADCCRYDY